jgi:hypothetical protein
MGKTMKIQVITSFDQAYYDLIGRESLQTWLQYWPKHMHITCYVEGFRLPGEQRVDQIDFDSLPQAYRDFQSRADKQVGRFAKKAWCFIHAMENATADRIIWLDADVITQSKVDMSVIESIMPDHCLCTHMGVTYYTKKTGEPGRWFVPETGFFAVNTQHDRFQDFLTEYRRRYVEWDCEDLRRFYDNDVYGAAVEKIGAPCVDLCDHFVKKYKTPMPHTVLGPYLHHWKAKHSKDTFSRLNQAADQ